jgi:hypothetical protein
MGVRSWRQGKKFREEKLFFFQKIVSTRSAHLSCGCRCPAKQTILQVYASGPMGRPIRALWRPRAPRVPLCYCYETKKTQNDNGGGGRQRCAVVGRRLGLGLNGTLVTFQHFFLQEIFLGKVGKNIFWAPHPPDGTPANLGNMFVVLLVL